MWGLSDISRAIALGLKSPNIFGSSTSSIVQIADAIDGKRINRIMRSNTDKPFVISLDSLIETLLSNLTR
jgi:hypothetical protein